MRELVMRREGTTSHILRTKSVAKKFGALVTLHVFAPDRERKLNIK